jgi:hypothetical protein
MARVLYFVPPLMAFFLCLFLTRESIGVSSDSRDYLSSAQSFTKTGELHEDDGEPQTFEPALFPVVIALVSFLAPPLVALRFLQATLAAIATLLIG